MPKSTIKSSSNSKVKSKEDKVTNRNKNKIDEKIKENNEKIKENNEKMKETKKKIKENEEKIKENEEKIKKINKLFSDIDKAITNKIKKGEKSGQLFFLRKYGNKENELDNIESGEPIDEENYTTKDLYSEKDKMEDFIGSISGFIDNLVCTKDLVNILIQDMVQIKKRDKEDLKQIIAKYKIAEDDITNVVAVSDKNIIKRIKSIEKNENILDESKIYQNFLISIVTLYENFLGDMLKWILTKYPEQLPDDKQLLYQDFLKFSSIDDIKNFYIGSYIRTIMGAKCFEQIKYVDKLLNKKDFLTNYIPIKELVEISSRRNLYVHNEGIINEQYVKNCKEVNIDNIGEIGDILKIDKSYFNNAFNTIYESTLKIAYLIFCKCSQEKDEIEMFDAFFNSNCFELISDIEDKEKISLSSHLLEFVTNYIGGKKEHNTFSKRMYTINLALCYKIQGNCSKCKDIINNEDRSTASSSFKLAIFVLEEKWKEASNLMSSATDFEREDVKNEEKLSFRDEDYRNFPIFFEFRKTKEFLDEYEKLFKRKFVE